MQRESFVLATGAAVAVCFASLACQGVMAADRAEEAASIVVTATRYPVPVNDVLPASIIIGRDELQRSLAPDITDLLRFHSGLEFGRNGGPGQTTSLFLRGTESNHTLVLVDGVRINPGTVGGAVLQNISPELVQRIEVVKGPRSTLYGTDAIGGVVQIFTHAAHADGFSSEGGYGEDDTLIGNATAGWQGDAAHLGFGVNYLETDGIAPRTDDPRGGAYDNLSFNLAGSVNVGAGELGVTYWRSAGSVDYIGFSDRTFDNALITQEYTSDAAAAAYSWSVGTWQSKIEVGHMIDDISQGRVSDSLGAFESADFATTNRTSVGWQNDFDVSAANRISAGIMHYDETADALSFGEIDTAATNVYLQDRIALDRHTIVLAAGYIDHQTFGGHATWNAEYGLQLGAATRLIAAAGTAFRAPDATDRFGFGGNPDLEPEESQNLELGLRYAIDERQRLSVSAFQNDIDELITYVVTNPLTFDGELRNTDRARIRGIEAAYEITGLQWRLRAEAIYQEPEDRATEDQLLRRANENFTVSYVRTFGRFELGADVLAAGKREDFGGVELDSYALANLTARYDIGAGWSANARIENILDEDYVLANGYNTQDRSLFVGVRYGGGGK